jgi:peptidoglycan/LPS O-acetylase OafA/YrhL
LSGFVLTCSLVVTPTPYKNFVIKRIFRIYPAFILVILVSYCLHCMIGNHPAATATEFLKRECNPVLSMTLLVQHLLMIGTKAAMRLDGVMWTLVYEMRISLIFPVILLSVMWYRWWAVLWYLLLSIGCTEFLFFATVKIASGGDDASFTATVLETGFFIIFFAVGAYLAIEREQVSCHIARLSQWRKALLFVATIYCVYKGVDYYSPWGAASDYFHGAGACGIIALAMGVPKFAKVLTHKITIWLGRISYSLYLVHLPILYAVSQTFAKSWNPLSVTIVTVAFSLIAAELLATTIEFPFIKLGKRLAAEREPARA